MAEFVPSSDLVSRVLEGDRRAIARMLSRVEAGGPEVLAAMKKVYQAAGRAHIVGITGVPGSGKSTLVNLLTKVLRNRGAKIAVIAIDPSSPYSGGSIMGDRIRMGDLACDAGVFIRSMATHGTMGGMARATLDCVDVLDAGGFDYIIIETVGVGQDEVEIARASHTTIVVSAPGLGDEIQAIKAGVLEIADIHVISKADRPDANRTVTDIKSMLAMGIGMSAKSDWNPAVVATNAQTGQGIDELVEYIDRHKEVVTASGALQARNAEIAAFRLMRVAANLVRDRFDHSPKQRFQGLITELTARSTSPHEAAEQLLKDIASGD